MGKHYIGEKINRLTLLKKEEPIVKKGKKYYRWKCQCDCGNTVVVLSSHLNRNQSCGCVQKERTASINKTHGMTKTKEFQAWKNMIARCKYNYDQYKTYKEKGIKVCDQWLNSFEQFFKDVGPAPEGKRVSLDRINNKGNYEPGNVRWLVNQSIQTINQELSTKNSSGIKGVCWCNTYKRWKAYIGVNKKEINLGSFTSKEDAIAARKAAEQQYHKPILNNNNEASK